MPKSAQHWRTLPDQLSGWFLSVFENDRRDAFPVHLLDVVWTRCGCGVEHARSACPECTDTVPVPASQVTRSAGSCRALTIHRSDGRILSAAAEGRLRYAYEAGGVVYRENGQRVMAQEVSPGMRFVIAGDSTYVIWQGQVVEMRNERVVWRTATAMFDACEDRCFVLRDDWLVEERSGSRIGRILAGQTWFRVGAELGYGFYQAGQITVHFLFRTDRPGLTQIDLPHLRGRLVDVRVAFDRRRLVVGFVTELDGQRTETLTLVGDDGRIVASMAGPVDRGLALSNGQLLQATDEGLLRVRADNPRGVLTPTELFTDTEPFVAADSGLLPGPDGTVYLICPREILQLSLA